jgi:hypothetical protein
MQDQQQKKQDVRKASRFNVKKLEERIAPSSGNFPPGQFPSGNPAQAPGRSNPNEVPATN